MEKVKPMKAVMYHYVREENKEFPFFAYLHFENFCKQLDYFSSKYEFISLDEFIGNVNDGRDINENGVIVTFDDGFIDHYEYVYPELVKRNLWAIFYVPTSVYNGIQILDVHSIHLLLGAYGGAEMMGAIKDLITDEMLADRRVKSFWEQT